jgi:hypothetical protein
MQPRCAALFGDEMEEVFEQLQKAGRAIEVACEMMANDVKGPQDGEALWFQMRADMLGNSVKMAKEPDRVDKMLEAFRGGI